MATSIQRIIWSSHLSASKGVVSSACVGVCLVHLLNLTLSHPTVISRVYLCHSYLLTSNMIEEEVERLLKVHSTFLQTLGSSLDLFYFFLLLLKLLLICMIWLFIDLIWHIHMYYTQNNCSWDGCWEWVYTLIIFVQ